MVVLAMLAYIVNFVERMVVLAVMAYIVNVVEGLVVLAILLVRRDWWCCCGTHIGCVVQILNLLEQNFLLSNSCL